MNILPLLLDFETCNVSVVLHSIFLYFVFHGKYISMIIEYSTPPHSAFLETCHHWDVHVQYCIFWHISVVFILDFMVLYSIFEYSTSPDWAFLVTCFRSDFRYRKFQRTFFLIHRVFRIHQNHGKYDPSNLEILKYFIKFWYS